MSLSLMKTAVVGDDNVALGRLKEIILFLRGNNCMSNQFSLQDP